MRMRPLTNTGDEILVGREPSFESASRGYHCLGPCAGFLCARCRCDQWTHRHRASGLSTPGGRADRHRDCRSLAHERQDCGRRSPRRHAQAASPCRGRSGEVGTSRGVNRSRFLVEFVGLVSSMEYDSMRRDKSREVRGCRCRLSCGKGTDNVGWRQRRKDAG